MPRTKKTQEEQVEEVMEAAKKAVATTRKATKKATEKAAEKAVVAAKEAAKKADTMTAEAKKAVAKAAKKPLKEEVYLQYAGKEINKDELVKQVKEIWSKELKNKIGDIATITLYLKPEENKAYYVINGEVSGSVDL
ncbi:MAG: DUF6465 family protein [Lachnospiraceae bacterium]|nr:DUF6465 family protein [Lachnospiraceae bacterium]MCD7767160.1 DUF6465 family protein [Lachnospiraceae bacterium]